MFNIDKGLISSIFVMVCFLLLLPTSLLSQEKKNQESGTQSEKQKSIDRLFRLSLEELMEVRVTTAGKTSQRVGNIPASVVLVTREDIETYGYRTLAEILGNVPGLFSIDDYSDQVPNFGVRGFWSGVANDNMIVLVNGVNQVNDFQSNFPLNKMAVPVEAIDRIEIIRGPMSVIYGNGAFYGVINIITNEQTKKPVSMVSGLAGSSKTTKLLVRASGKRKDFHYFFNASIYDTGGIDEALSNMSGDPAILPSIGVPLDNRTGGRLESNEKYLSFSGTFGGFFVNLSYNEGTTELYFVLPSVTDGSRDNITATRLFFGYREDLSKRVRFEGKFSYAQIRDSFTYDHLFPGFYGIEDVETIGWEGEVNTFLKPTSSLDIVAGLYYRSVFKADDTFNLPSFGVPSLENNHNFLVDSDAIVTRALFTQVDYTPSKKLRLVAGVRLEQSLKYELRHEQFSGANPPDLMSDVYDREEIEVIPRLAAIYFCNDRNIVKFLYGKAINRPSFFQNTLNSLDPLREDLEPESIETLEFNYIATVSSHLSFNISIFRNTLDNLITRVVRFDENNEYTSWSDNAGKMVTHGIELEVSAEPIEYLRMELSGSYQNTEDKRPDFENIDVAYSPNLPGYLKASYLGVGFKVAVTGQYVGAMEAFWDETRANEDGSLGGRIGDKVYSYLLLSTNLRFDDLFKEGVFINIKVSNLLDKEIRYPTFTNNEWANRGTIGAGRTFLVSMGYKF